MLAIDNIQVIEGVTVYGDDEDLTKFYVMPDVPRFRMNESGKPSFAFYKYRNPIDRADESKGGGFLICDVEFSLTPEKQQAVVAALQEQLNQKFPNRDPKPQVKIGAMTYTKGTAKLNVENISEKFVEKVFNPGKPSLYGRNITPFTVELTDQGATFFEQALQNKGGFVQIAYDLYAPVKLPPIEVHIWFVASKFMEFTQEFEKRQTRQGAFASVWKWLFGGTSGNRTEITQSMEEESREYQWGGVDIDFKDFKATEETKQRIRDWAWASLAEAVKASQEMKLDVIKEEQKKIPENLTDFHNRISQFKFSSYDQKYRESQAVEWNFAPQGMLEPIINLKDKDGNLLKWEDYSTVVDLDDPFFKSLDIAVTVNADFEDLPIHSVDVFCEYQEGQTKESKGFSIKSPNQIERFKSFIENNKWDYKYWYQVNYKGESNVYKSPELVGKGGRTSPLTINVGDTGVLAVDVTAGDLNWSQVTQAQVTVEYDAVGAGNRKVQHEYILDKEHPRHELREVVFAPVNKPYKYQVKYFMADGKEYEVSEKTSDAPRLFVNDPFSTMKRINFLAVGNLDSQIQTIFVEAKYVDEKNDYVKTTAIALSKSTPFFEWEFPAIDEQIGSVTYKGLIQYINGQTETIAEATTQDQSIPVGQKIEDVLAVRVQPIGIDFKNTVTTVIVSLRYVDEAHRVDESWDLIFDAADSASQKPQSWTLPLKDKTKTEYEWSAMFFLNDGSERHIAPQKTRQLTIPLRLPVAAAAGR
jgi:hypothetical protein